MIKNTIRFIHILITITQSRKNYQIMYINLRLAIFLRSLINYFREYFKIYLQRIFYWKNHQFRHNLNFISNSKLLMKCHIKRYHRLFSGFYYIILIIEQMHSNFICFLSILLVNFSIF